MVSEFATLLWDTEKYMADYDMAEHNYLTASGKLYDLYKAGKGNPKQRKLAKELLEEAGLI